eukprot:1590937-Prymnesium_polylepis.1
MSVELLILLYFSYGMQLMGDDTACPTSRNSWLEYSRPSLVCAPPSSSKTSDVCAESPAFT